MLEKKGFEQKAVTEQVNIMLKDYRGDGSVPFVSGNYDVSSNNYQNTRNQVQGYLKNVSDRNCMLFMTHSLSTQAKVNFGLQSTALVLSGIGGLLGPESTSQALAGASSMTSGVAQQVGSNFYREKTVEILTKAIRTRREAQWADIKSKQTNARAANPTPYLINDAIADVVEYNNSCSLVNGFEEILSAVQDREAEVVEAIADQKTDENKKVLTVKEIIQTTR